MTYGIFTDLPRRRIADKVLRNKSYNFAKNPKYDGYQRGIASWVFKCFEKESFGSGVKSKFIPNQQLAEELRKSIIKKFEKMKNIPIL